MHPLAPPVLTTLAMTYPDYEKGGAPIIQMLEMNPEGLPNFQWVIATDKPRMEIAVYEHNEDNPLSFYWDGYQIGLYTTVVFRRFPDQLDPLVSVEHRRFDLPWIKKDGKYLPPLIGTPAAILFYLRQRVTVNYQLKYSDDTVAHI